MCGGRGNVSGGGGGAAFVHSRAYAPHALIQLPRVCVCVRTRK